MPCAHSLSAKEFAAAVGNGTEGDGRLTHTIRVVAVEIGQPLPSRMDPAIAENLVRQTIAMPELPAVRSASPKPSRTLRRPLSRPARIKLRRHESAAHLAPGRRGGTCAGPPSRREEARRGGSSRARALPSAAWTDYAFPRPGTRAGGRGQTAHTTASSCGYAIQQSAASVTLRHCDCPRTVIDSVRERKPGTDLFDRSVHRQPEEPITVLVTEVS